LIPFTSIGDCDALFREIHRILKQDGVLFMDPGHMEMSRATEVVEGTGLFTITDCRGHDMLVAPKAHQRGEEFWEYQFSGRSRTLKAWVRRYLKDGGE